VVGWQLKGNKLSKERLKEGRRDPIACGTWGIFASRLALAREERFPYRTPHAYSFVTSCVLEAGHCMYSMLFISRLKKIETLRECTPKRKSCVAALQRDRMVG
jgi:hypothetical protein